MQVSSEGRQTTYPGFSLYPATKWGIEGFVETVAQEVAPLDIDCIIVEPGLPPRFGANAERVSPGAAYEATPVGELHPAIASGSFVPRAMPLARLPPSPPPRTHRGHRCAWPSAASPSSGIDD